MCKGPRWADEAGKGIPFGCRAGAGGCWGRSQAAEVTEGVVTDVKWAFLPI